LIRITLPTPVLAPLPVVGYVCSCSRDSISRIPGTIHSCGLDDYAVSDKLGAGCQHFPRSTGITENWATKITAPAEIGLWAVLRLAGPRQDQTAVAHIERRLWVVVRTMQLRHKSFDTESFSRPLQLASDDRFRRLAVADHRNRPGPLLAESCPRTSRGSMYGCGRILPSWAGCVNVRNWPSAAERRPAREGPLADPLLTSPGWRLAGGPDSLRTSPSSPRGVSDRPHPTGRGGSSRRALPIHG
jgi:hypothetical protein